MIARRFQTRRSWIKAAAILVLLLLGTGGIYLVTTYEPNKNTPGHESSTAPLPAPESLNAGNKVRKTAGSSGSPSATVDDQEGALFLAALAALENGRLSESQTKLEELTRRNPQFPGAADLSRRLATELWKEKLPLRFRAVHDHRIGECTGELILYDWGIEYRSEEHGVWAWSFGELKRINRHDPFRLELETYETDLLRAGTSKRYNFSLLNEPIEERDWVQYQDLLR